MLAKKQKNTVCQGRAKPVYSNLDKLYSFCYCPYAKQKGMHRKRQTSPRIKGRHLKETVAHRDGGLLFMRHIAFFRGICGKQAFSPCFVSFAQLRRVSQDPKQILIRIQAVLLRRSPSPFQSGCRSRRWPARHPACWQRANFSAPSQMV